MWTEFLFPPCSPARPCCRDRRRSVCVAARPFPHGLADDIAAAVVLACLPAGTRWPPGQVHLVALAMGPFPRCDPDRHGDLTRSAFLTSAENLAHAMIGSSASHHAGCTSSKNAGPGDRFNWQRMTTWPGVHA